MISLALDDAVQKVVLRSLQEMYHKGEPVRHIVINVLNMSSES
uniref:Uncharacterized protein n=1 Tax=Rhizophora mucronata TaxID=61149 RepID=A0A2P2KJS6_RHIMU